MISNVRATLHGTQSLEHLKFIQSGWCGKRLRHYRRTLRYSSRNVRESPMAFRRSRVRSASAPPVKSDYFRCSDVDEWTACPQFCPLCQAAAPTLNELCLERSGCSICFAGRIFVVRETGPIVPSSPVKYLVSMTAAFSGDCAILRASRLVAAHESDRHVTNRSLRG